MSNLSIKLNLSKLKGSALTKLKNKQGQEVRCVIIPVDENGLFVGEKGVYLDLTAFEMQNPAYDQTHFVKQSVSKEKYQAMTEEQRNSVPILGGLKPFGKIEMAPTDEYSVPEGQTDDLPF